MRCVRREPSDEELEILHDMMAVYEFRKANGCPMLGGPTPRALCPGPHSPLCPELTDADLDAAVSAETALLDEELDSL